MTNILRNLSRKPWLIMVIALASLVIVLFVVFLKRCDYLNTIIPEAPIYPNSILMTSELTRTGGIRPLVTLYYETDSPLEDVILFYSEQGNCSEAKETANMICRGNAAPFGEYFIYVEDLLGQVSDVTEYAVELRWQGCTYTLE